MTQRPSLTIGVDGDQLAAELGRHGIALLGRHRDGETTRLPLPPDELLAGLASSNEARLRMAIVPLLLWNPDLAPVGTAAAGRLADAPRLTLMCYLTAAVLLQRQHRQRLADLCRATTPLPDLFSALLGLDLPEAPDAGLRMLARCHAALTSDAVDWLGTYRHSALPFLARMEVERTWST